MISLKGFNQQIVTMKKSGTPTVNAPAVLSANYTAAAASADATFIGIISSVNDETVGVQMTGYVESSYTGTTAPTRGYCTLAANGSGGVKVASSGRTVIVTNVDTIYRKVGFIL